MPKRPSDTVTATEIASFVYCKEAWRLEHALRLPAANQRERTAGTHHHREKVSVERAAGSSQSLGRFLILAALIALAAWLLSR